MIQQLKRGYAVLFDDADEAMVKQRTWYASRNGRRIYAMTKIDGKTVYLHRLILGITDRKTDVDHINHDGLDCRRENLRIATRSQNMGNARKWSVPTSSRHKGVTWDKERGKWSVKIMKNYKTINLGRFESELEAAKAYNVAAVRVFDDFTHGNQVSAAA